MPDVHRRRTRAGRRALDDVLEYIAQLHDAVRSKSTPWREIFRTWRKISEELRRKAAEADVVKAAKREDEAVRSVTRKAARKSLAEHGCSTEEIEFALKTLEAPLGLAHRDADVKNLFDALVSLEKSLDAHRARLEELGDERTGLVLQPLWWVIERSRRPGLDPYEAVVLEQVPAVMPVWKEYEKVLAALDYRTKTQMMHTEAFGVPQTRRRAVLMARYKTDVRELEETHHRYRPGGVPAASLDADRADTPLWGVDEASVGRRKKRRPKGPWVPMEAALKEARRIARRPLQIWNCRTALPSPSSRTTGQAATRPHEGAVTTTPRPRRSPGRCPATGSSTRARTQIFPASNSPRPGCSRRSPSRIPGRDGTGPSRSATQCRLGSHCTCS